MSHDDVPAFGRGIEDKNALQLFYRGMLLKLQNCGVPPPAHTERILEVGSGNGNFLTFLRKRGLDVEGVDIEPRGPGVKKANIAELPYPPESFNYVMSKHVFDGWHYPQSPADQKAMLSEIVRVLKKDGAYYAVENFFEPIAGLELLSDPSGNQGSSVYKKV
ncbi:MAG: class I SAM-dependent methyltransferase [bacterium]|nr:class I SAM-dependent methyltransferase [bacterium]